MMRNGMSRLVIVVLIGVFVLLCTVAVTIISRNQPDVPKESFELQLFKELCVNKGGTWLPRFKECEWVDAQACNDGMGGMFVDCMSPCRHDPEATVCTMNCVPVCTFRG